MTVSSVIQAQKGRYLARRFTLAALIRNAYRVQEFQINSRGRVVGIRRLDVEAFRSDPVRSTSRPTPN